MREEDGGVALGLFLDDAVMAAAAAADPHHRRPRLVARAALSALACAAEGVSHFVYLATRAAAGRPVSLLELEVQAEVDKFALLLLHLWRRGLRRTSRALRRRLFERVRYHAHLDAGGARRATARRTGSAAGTRGGSRGASWTTRTSRGCSASSARSYRRGGGEKIAYLGA